MKRRVLIVALAVAVLMLAQVPVTAAEAASDEVPSFDGFLQALSGPLVAAAVAIILSWVVEYWPAYGELAPRWKRLSYFGLCVVVPLIAAVLRGALGYAPWSFDPLIWHALWNGAAAGGIGTLVHGRKLPAA